jgi:alkylated DNA repair dioxygenase AlkB
MPDTLDLFATTPGVPPRLDTATLPAGVCYASELIDAEAQTTLVAAIQQLDLRPFEFHRWRGLRRTRSFGYRYDYARSGVVAAEPIPTFLEPLRARAAGFAGTRPLALQQALITEYAPGAPIGWHRDKPEFGIVIGISLLSACVLRFRRWRADRNRRWDRSALELAPRSAYLLSGDSRVVWEHSIAPMPALRYSVTFRTLRASGDADPAADAAGSPQAAPPKAPP